MGAARTDEESIAQDRPQPGRLTGALGALAYRNYRIYWFSAFTFVLGWQILRVIFAWVAYDLTGSALYLGFLGFVQTVGTLSVVLLGGVAADRVNRRALLFLTQGSMAATVFALLALSQAGMLEAWHLLAASAAIGVTQGIDQPTRTAVIPALIDDRRQLMNALALGSSVWQGTRIFGPAVGGILLERVGVTTTFGVVATALVLGTMLLTALRIPRVVDRQRGSVVRELVEGLDFIRRRRLFASLIMLTFVDSFFGTAYIYLLPVFAVDVFGVGADAMGLMLGASAAGRAAGHHGRRLRGPGAVARAVALGGRGRLRGAGYWLSAPRKSCGSHSACCSCPGPAARCR